MIKISHLIEPNRLLLIWQSSNPTVRKKFIVGELVRASDRVSLTYAYYSHDLQEAMSVGFTGHPAFPLDVPVHHFNVVEVFSRRLPPRNRSDFRTYLEKHRIDPVGQISDFALLGFTGATLPGDGFMCAIDYRYETMPHLFLMEVAGFRYNAGMHLEISAMMGQVVTFMPEIDNPHDQNAVRIFVAGLPIGYVPRYYAALMRTWLSSCMTMGVIERIDGTLTKPQVHIAVSVISHYSGRAQALL
ncbi:HIRAN domain-containing protein [Sphingomonas sp. BK481]|uniref:HIRAN domain-containing protein n=1 Tax=Sphingomonas sp. BK481 TaxID=2586981 RepID=UPI0016173204|nr:HIRAN domain-containing protein [Sphingomonas sp. BK481]MBB3587769.1 hypothetical protein [Sphingomonas sp. BK481]